MTLTGLILMSSLATAGVVWAVASMGPQLVLGPKAPGADTYPQRFQRAQRELMKAAATQSREECPKPT